MRRPLPPIVVALERRPKTAFGLVPVVIPAEAAGATNRVPDRFAFLPHWKESPRVRAVDLAISLLGARPERGE